MRLHAGASSAAVQDSRGGRGGRGRAPKLALVIGFALLSSLVLGVTLAAAVVPTVSVEEASSVGFTGAHVGGTIDPQGQATGFRFEYATQEDFSDAAVGAEGTVEGATQPVEGDLTGLAPNTTYHLRLVAENGDGPSEAVAADVFTTKEVTPPAVSIESAGAVTATAAHLSGHVTPGGTDPAFNTSWRFECSPECPGLVGGEINPADESSHEVETDATGLEPNTPYTVTLYASNLGGEASAEVSFDTAAIAPSDVQTLAVHGPVADTSARLVGAVNSNNSPASYWFEYGPADCALNPCTSVPASHDGAVAPASQVQLVGQDISGLQPETTYHYRFVVEGSLGGQQVGADRTVTTSDPIPAQPSSCPNEAIRTEQHATHLPDCRAYELVSTADKGLNPLLGAAPLSLDGDHVLYNVEGPTPGSPSGSHPTLIASRTSSGWQSRNILPPRAQMPDASYLVSAVTPDLSKIAVSAFDGSGKSTGAPQVTLATLDGFGGQTTLHTFPTFFGSSGIAVVASEDLSHLFVSVAADADPSLPANVPGIENIYDFGSGTPQLADAMPGTGTAPDCGSSGNQAQEFAISGSSRQSEHWTSTDGSRLFFATHGDVCSDPVQLYVRDLHAATTTLISGPPLAGDPDNGVDRFLQATPSGSQVFYRTATSYDAEDDLDGNSSDMDIYRWTSATAQSLCITCSLPGADVMVNDGQNIHAAIAEDGSHAYFDSTGKFAGAPTLGSNEAPNTYLWRTGQSQIEFVARTSGITSLPAFNGYVTPSGNVLIFTSSSPGLNSLTGTDNGGFPQYYRYDSRDTSVTCISCPSTTVATGGVSETLARGVGSVSSSVRPASEDGNTVLFSTAGSLVPADDNGSADIYEWDHGSLALVTDGSTSRSEGSVPFVVDVSPSRRDVLFVDPSARLTFNAQDDTSKLYDARIGGGFPSPPPPPVPCAETHCFPSPAQPLGALAAGSDAAAGPGNVQAKHMKRHKHKKKHKHGKNQRHGQRPADGNRGGVK